jgi:putative endonuclease
VIDRRGVARLGERIAERFLVDRGARVVGRNVRVGHKEADLLVEMGGERVVVEVKTQLGGPDDADPIDSLTPGKLRHLRQMSGAFEGDPPRVDFVGVTMRREGVSVRWLPAIG